MFLPQGANEPICGALGVQGTNVSDVQETRHFVRHVSAENPRESKTHTQLARHAPRAAEQVTKSLPRSTPGETHWSQSAKSGPPEPSQDARRLLPVHNSLQEIPATLAFASSKPCQDQTPHCGPGNVKAGNSARSLVVTTELETGVQGTPTYPSAYSEGKGARKHLAPGTAQHKRPRQVQGTGVHATEDN